MRNVQAALWLASAAILIATQAVAQQAPGSPLIAGANLFDVRLGVDATYDSNVDRTDAADSALRQIKPGDWIVSPSITIDIFKPLGRESVFLKGSAGYSFYATNHVLNSANVDVNGGANGQFGPCHATVIGDEQLHRNSQQFATLSSPVDVRNVEDNHSIGGNATCARPTGIGVTLAASQDWDENSSVLYHMSDYRRASVSGGLIYQRPTFGSLSLFGEYDQTEYDNRFILVDGTPTQDGYKSVSGGVKFDRRLGARIEATLSLAYTSLTPFLPGEPGFSGPTYSADVSYRPTGRITTHLEISRQETPTNSLNATFSNTQLYLAEGTYRIGARMSLTLGASDGESRYGGEALIPGVNLGEQTTHDIYSAFRFDFTHRLSATLNVRYEEGRANLAEFTYDDTRAGLTLAAAF